MSGKKSRTQQATETGLPATLLTIAGLLFPLAIEAFRLGHERTAGILVALAFVALVLNQAVQRRQFAFEDDLAAVLPEPDTIESVTRTMTPLPQNPPDSPEQPRDQPDGDGDEPTELHPCDECGQVYISAEALNGHQTAHTSDGADGRPSPD